MHSILTLLAAMLLKTGVVLLVANEIRGVIMAVPVLYGMYAAGGTMMAIWIGLCSLGGIALSVVVPLFVGRKLKII